MRYYEGNGCTFRHCYICTVGHYNGSGFMHSYGSWHSLTHMQRRDTTCFEVKEEIFFVFCHHDFPFLV